MRLSDLHAPTLRATPRDLDHPGQRVLARAAVFRLLDAVPGAGLALLPAGALAVARLGATLRAAIASPRPQPIFLPSPPTPERGAVDHVAALLARDLRSYKELPRAFAVEAVAAGPSQRARAGLLGAREEPVLDLWLVAEADALDPLDAIVAGVTSDLARVISDLGVAFERVVAPDGQRWIVSGLTDDVVAAWCECCGEGAIAALAPVVSPARPVVDAAAWRAVETPDQRSVEEVAAFLGATPADLLKTMIVEADGAPIAALVPGDRELSLPKLAAVLGARQIALASDEVVAAATGAPVGFAGPIGLAIPIVADRAAVAGSSWITGGNARDVHFIDVTPGRDFAPSTHADITTFVDGDPCPACAGPRWLRAGTEIAVIERHGAAPAERIGLAVDAAGGGQAAVAFARVRIRLGRLLGAIAEARVDADGGFVWPAAVAPWDVAVIALGKPNDATNEAAEEVVAALRARGLVTLFDDRPLRPGQKLSDAEIMGHPLVAVVGRRGLERGVVELRRRLRGDVRAEREAGAGASEPRRRGRAAVPGSAGAAVIDVAIAEVADAVLALREEGEEA